MAGLGGVALMLFAAGTVCLSSGCSSIEAPRCAPPTGHKQAQAAFQNAWPASKSAVRTLSS